LQNHTSYNSASICRRFSLLWRC